MEKIKRHFYNGVHYKLDEEKQTVTIMPEFFNQLKNKNLWGKFGFKKIGGSSIGDVLEVDQFKSQFSAFCKIMWIGLPILDKKYINAGIAIEPKVINIIKKITQKEITTYDPKEYNFDFFKDKDDVLGGIPDGFIKEDNVILEIKTTGAKNLENWKNWGIPEAYHKQSQLYAYLMNCKKYSIVATFLEEEDYINPENYPINERIVKNWNFEINENKVIDDIKKVKEWYYHYTKSGISPKYDNIKDADLIEWLKPQNKLEWEKLMNKWIEENKIK